jgi:uncharacterized paraquat-inducible protein A
MRTETCPYCDVVFRVKPMHPAWEVGQCPECWGVIAQMWHWQYVTPTEIENAIRAENV